MRLTFLSYTSNSKVFFMQTLQRPRSETFTSMVGPRKQTAITNGAKNVQKSTPAVKQIQANDAKKQPAEQLKVK